MGIFKNLYNNLFNKSKNTIFSSPINSNTTVNYEHEELIKFKKKLEDLSDPNDNLYDYLYWYSFVKQRAESILNTVDPHHKDEENLKDWVFGHADEYSKRLINESVEQKVIFIKPRIICYGKIYEMIKELKKNIASNYSNDNSLIDRLQKETFHAEASLYGAIKFAVLNKIDETKILEWYPNYQKDNTITSGDNAMNPLLKKITTLDEKDVNEKRIEIYELEEKQLNKIPFWFRKRMFDVGFFEKGRTYSDKKSNKKIKLNSLERTIFFHFEIETFIFNSLSKEIKNQELYIDLYEKIELTKEWFKETNEKAYSILFK